MSSLRIPTLFLIVIGACLVQGDAQAAPLSVAVTPGVNANCIFDSDCSIFVSDTSATIGTTGGFVQSRRFPVGEPGTPGEGIHAYLYRVDLRNALGILAIDCVRTLDIPFGGIVRFDYDGDGSPEDLWESTTGIGNVSIASAERLDDVVRITFAGSGVCQGAFAGGGDSSFFFGLASPYDDVHADGQLSFNLAPADEAIDLRVPDRPVTAAMTDYAFAWANDASAPVYTPSSFYSYNRGGGPITITRNGLGEYRVEFEGMGDLWSQKGIAQVTAYGGSISDGHCTPADWGPDWVDVVCYEDSGWARDSQFTVLLAKPMPIRQGVAWVRGDQPSATSYIPAPQNVYNPSGDTTTIQRLGVGLYAVRFNGFGTPTPPEPGSGGNVQVTGVGPSGARCAVNSWNPTTADVVVECSWIPGGPFDAEFSLLWVKPDVRFDRDLAYAWSDVESTSAYEPSARYASNPADGGVFGTRNLPGDYVIEWDGLSSVSGPTGGHIQVTPYGGTSPRCEVRSWGSETANVQCYGATGTATDNRFSVLRLQPTTVPEPATSLAVLFGAGALLGNAARGRRRNES